MDTRKCLFLVKVMFHGVRSKQQFLYLIIYEGDQARNTPDKINCCVFFSFLPLDFLSIKNTFALQQYQLFKQV